MVRRVGCFMFALAFTANAFAQSPLPRSEGLTGPIADELRQHVVQLFAARSSRDPVRLAAHYPGQGGEFFDVTHDARGAAEHLRKLNDFLEHFSSLSLVPGGLSSVGRIGPLAWTVTNIRGQGMLKTGRPITFDARHTAVFSGAPGSWLVAHEHFSVPSTTLLMESSPEPTVTTEEQAAIRSVLDLYVQAWNRADARAMAVLWDEQGDTRSAPRGTITVGRDAIASLWTQRFTRRAQQNSMVAAVAQLEALRPLAPGIVTADGRFRLFAPGGSVNEEELFTFIFVRRDVWRILSARVATVRP